MTVKSIAWDKKIELVASKVVEGSSSFVSPTFEADYNRMLKVLR
jgi:hypothetical protein